MRKVLKNSWTQISNIGDLSDTHIFLWNGFEGRSTKFLRSAKILPTTSVYAYRFANDQYDLSVGTAVIEECASNGALHFFEIERREQFSSFSHFYNLLQNIDDADQIVFDITCFPRDILLIFLLSLFKTGKLSRLICLYNIASNYCIESSSGEKWLSKGISYVSPMLGYRGFVRPDFGNLLICLVGFDHDRIGHVIDALRPDKIVFAIGKSKYPEREWLTNRNKIAVKNFSVAFSNPITEEFDCENESSISGLITRKFEEFEDHNIILLPMHNKISTLFCGAFALIEKKLQICFGGGNVYNHSNYSQESERFLFWRYSPH